MRAFEWQPPGSDCLTCKFAKAHKGIPVCVMGFPISIQRDPKNILAAQPRSITPCLRAASIHGATVAIQVLGRPSSIKQYVKECVKYGVKPEWDTEKATRYASTKATRPLLVNTKVRARRYTRRNRGEQTGAD